MLHQRHADVTEFVIPKDDACVRFLSLLAENSIVPTRFEMQEPTLNEIFIDKVGERIESEGGNAQ